MRDLVVNVALCMAMFGIGSLKCNLDSSTRHLAARANAVCQWINQRFDIVVEIVAQYERAIYLTTCRLRSVSSTFFRKAYSAVQGAGKGMVFNFRDG